MRFKNITWVYLFGNHLIFYPSDQFIARQKHFSTASDLHFYWMLLLEPGNRIRRQSLASKTCRLHRRTLIRLGSFGQDAVAQIPRVQHPISHYFHSLNGERGCKQRPWCWFYELMMADDDAQFCDSICTAKELSSQ